MKVFVSYRRSDCQDMAARIVDKLKETPGIGRVFFDVDSIAPGADFADSIRAALDQCDVCLILIGNDWRGAAGEEAQPRLDRPEDYVRQEAVIALESGKRVIPVLLNNTDMPTEETLPEPVRPLTTLNAVFLRHLSFSQDLELLVDAIHGRKAGGRIAGFLRRRPLLAMLLRATLGILAGLITLLILAIVHKAMTGNALNQSFGTGVVWLLIITALIGGAVLPNYLSRR